MEGERSWKNFKKSEKYKNRFDTDALIDDSWDFYNRNGRDRKNRKGKYSKIAYLTGFYSGFESVLQKTHKKVKNVIDPENKLPVLIDDPLLEEKYQSHYNPTTWNTGWGGSSGEGWDDGRSAGKAVKIRQGVTGSTRRGRLIMGDDKPIISVAVPGNESQGNITRSSWNFILITEDENGKYQMDSSIKKKELTHILASVLMSNIMKQ